MSSERTPDQDADAVGPSSGPTAGSDAGEGGGEDEFHAFWADAVADEIEARDPDDPIVIKGGVSPSGIPHLGHFNEIIRGHFVAEVLRERGHEVRQVFTSDDRDPLRKLPRRLADADWNVVELGAVDAGALGKNLGKPYTAIPDPFGDCHESYGEHFADLLSQAADMVDVPVEVLSNTELYETGEFEPEIRTILENVDTAREVLSAYQDSVDETYSPFRVVCEECGIVTTEVAVTDLDAGLVEYECTGITAGDREIEGCGHHGEATLRDGKLSWRFEWPAQWSLLGVDFEPFGKDHAEGSWPSGEDIARNVLGIEPPVPMTYEWFTLNGEPLSSSEGNVVTVPEVLDLLEPEVLRYFFALDPNKARDFDISRLDQLVDDFDRFERAYFGDVDDEELTRFAERAYPFVVEEVREDRIRLPYTFAAVLGMVEDRDLRVRMARNEGHIPEDADDDAVENALERVEKARSWAERCDNAYNYRLQPDLPDVDLDDDEAAALDDLADFVAAGHGGEAIQGEIYELAEAHGLGTSDLFAAGYRLFFDKTQGPRLGEFLGELDRSFVVERLRREG
ncbi:MULTISPECIES: lysine--tRNA ligase [Halolamina]|uniref:Lysine--tRNA ligase n=1 Tax=Halolamina pelagica TaxID=699431 RepID=A0A1I5Q6F6_9EURY|nr:MULTISPECIES: lysine--tRNA ligase [Halolamina]NHX35116.1 lysine--tRNA ligase [Halolamina sp. R1-12]SFP41812.1 lysyl-tRNA synthetase, class I [Halolamina pelagica]